MADMAFTQGFLTGQSKSKPIWSFFVNLWIFLIKIKVLELIKKNDKVGELFYDFCHIYTRSWSHVTIHVSFDAPKRKYIEQLNDLSSEYKHQTLNNCLPDITLSTFFNLSWRFNMNDPKIYDGFHIF